MKTRFKTIIALVIAFTVISVSNMSAQCSARNEVQVTNINQVKAFMTFTNQQPIKVGNNIVGYIYTESTSRGHRRSGGCCQFNRGFCGRFSKIDVETDLLGNITKSSFTMFTGTSDSGDYLRFEGIKVDDDI